MSAEAARAIARSIRAERSRLGLSQTELGERLGWSQAKVTSIERGARNLYAHELPDVAVALGVPLRDLLKGLPAPVLRSLGL
jgi:transcriptional regulator with XRE-family HTH domain